MFRYLTFFILMIAINASAQQKVTVEDFLRFEYPSEYAVHPTSGEIIFTVKLADFSESRWEKNLWLLKNDKTWRQFTFGKNSNNEPAFSRDGSRIFFISDRAQNNPGIEKKWGGDQIWQMPYAGGEGRCITNLQNGVDAYKISSDGKYLIIRSAEDQLAELLEKQNIRETAGFDEIVKDSVRQNIAFWKYDLENSAISLVGVADPGADEFSISPDGDRIVYQTNYSGDFNDEQKYDIWMMNVTSGEKTQLTDFPGPETMPKISSDGKWLAFINQTTPEVEFAETDINILPLSTTGGEKTPRNLSGGFNRSIIDYEWIPGKSELICRIADGLTTPVYKFDLHNNAKIVSTLGGNYLDIKMVGGKIYSRWEDETHLPEIVRLDGKGDQLKSDFSAQISKYNFGEQKSYKWKSVDGQEIEGLLFLPPDFDPTKKYPLVLMVHGGPFGRVRLAVRQSSYKQIYSSDGYVVLAPNPRGSSGYDDEFGKAIWHQRGGAMGGIDYHDIMSGVNSLLQEGYIDEKRMGVMGGSYGGYLTNWIISQTDRFATAVSQFGIFSFFTDWSNSWQPAFEKMYFGIYYWERPITRHHPYVKFSPAFYVENIKTPVLILHGERDKYTNLANSQEMYQALKTLGREVKFVIYPNENHGMSKKPNHRRNVVHRSKQWMDKYLK